MISRTRASENPIELNVVSNRDTIEQSQTRNSISNRVDTSQNSKLISKYDEDPHASSDTLDISKGQQRLFKEDSRDSLKVPLILVKKSVDPLGASANNSGYIKDESKG